jgi:hypothetical protein
VQHSKFVSTGGKQEVASLTWAERGNPITLITYMNATSTFVPPLIVSEKKYERGAYGWGTGGLNFGLPSKMLDSD